MESGWLPSNESAVSDTAGAGTGLGDWHGNVLQQIVHSLTDTNQHAYEAQLQTAMSALRGLPPDDPMRIAAGFQLNYYRFQAAGLFDDPELHHLAWCEAVYELSIPVYAVMAERLRIRLLLQVLCKGDALCYEPLTPKAYRELAAQVPEKQRGPEFWFNVAGWAFRHQQADVLADAYAAVLVNPGSFLATASWLRINLMHLLLEQRAQQQDLFAYLRAIPHSGLLDEFERYIVPVAKALGIDSPDLHETISRQREHLALTQARHNWYEPPTRNIRNHV